MIDLSTLDGFEWDGGNREKNWILHKVAWTEAEEAFLSEPLLLLPDPKHSQAENRFAVLGRTLADRRIVIVFTIRNNRIRVISARDMSMKERKMYDEATEKDT
jgi:uncharacterized DUF497 family protein